MAETRTSLAEAIEWLEMPTAIPIEHVAEAGERLWTGYERDWINNAPRCKGDEISAVPAEVPD